MRGSSIITGAAIFYVGFVLVKDGTILRLFDDANRFLKDSARAVRPITRVG